MQKVDARGEDIKLGSLGLWTRAFGTIWPIFAVGLYDSKESLQLTQYSVYKAVKAAFAKLVKISKGIVSKVAQTVIFCGFLFFLVGCGFKKKKTQTTNTTPHPQTILL